MLSSSWGWSWIVFQLWCLPGCLGDTKAILQWQLALATAVFQFFRLRLEREIAPKNLPVLSCTFLFTLDSQNASAEYAFLGVVAQILPLLGEYVRTLT